MNKKILIVDDDVDILDALKFLLEDRGYKVSISSKADYVERLTEGKKDLPDLIILDVMLGDKDGRVVCRKLKNSDKTKHIPIIMVSAHPNSERSSLDANASSFLAKPFESNVLIKTIESYL